MGWLIVHNVPGREYGYRAIIDRDGFTICDPSPMGEANARLIAAAPDMLAALEAVMADINVDMPAERVILIQSVINQAKGV